ncbi:response regulator [Oscillochloris sp. ZM17-4]|uniref:response regulator n=1 Tax=Oscillochloris sp. ZM17-4 TaxID=2866714 RepID=UPI001C73D5A8|nr:response regulator [Oscillochloris sp. ZM17-4]MBX0329208.1 response regulator [Oscillochloris sp. ZM17-4]
MGGNLRYILIVDDEPDICWALKRMLQVDGFSISTAGSGAEALELVRQRHYSVAFIDAILPDANGIRLSEQIHTMSSTTALVIMSGYYYREDQRLASAPITGFLAKPFLLSDVQTTLQQALLLSGSGSFSLSHHDPMSP